MDAGREMVLYGQDPPTTCVFCGTIGDHLCEPMVDLLYYYDGFTITGRHYVSPMERDRHILSQIFSLTDISFRNFGLRLVHWPLAILWFLIKVPINSFRYHFVEKLDARRRSNPRDFEVTE